MLVGPKKARLLGVSRQRVNRLARSHSQFSRPDGELAPSHVGRRREIVEWAKSNSRRVLTDLLND